MADFIIVFMAHCIGNGSSGENPKQFGVIC
jgi:hypothetical protein